jgi:hypothetical protein
MKSFTYAGLLYLLAIVAIVGYLNNRLGSKKEGFAQSEAEFGAIIGVTFFVIFVGGGALAYWAWRN